MMAEYSHQKILEDLCCDFEKKRYRKERYVLIKMMNLKTRNLRERTAIKIRRGKDG